MSDQTQRCRSLSLFYASPIGRPALPRLHCLGVWHLARESLVEKMEDAGPNVSVESKVHERLP